MKNIGWNECGDIEIRRIANDRLESTELRVLEKSENLKFQDSEKHSPKNFNWC